MLELSEISATASVCGLDSKQIWEDLEGLLAKFACNLSVF